MVPENYNYLNPAETLDLCCSVVQFIPLNCGSIAVTVKIFELSLNFTEKRFCRSFR